jgi:hypothetical protein
MSVLMRTKNKKRKLCENEDEKTRNKQFKVFIKRTFTKLEFLQFHLLSIFFISFSLLWICCLSINIVNMESGDSMHAEPPKNVQMLSLEERVKISMRRGSAVPIMKNPLENSRSSSGEDWNIKVSAAVDSRPITAVESLDLVTRLRALQQ